VSDGRRLLYRVNGESVFDVDLSQVAAIGARHRQLVDDWAALSQEGLQLSVVGSGGADTRIRRILYRRVPRGADNEPARPNTIAAEADHEPARPNTAAEEKEETNKKNATLRPSLVERLRGGPKDWIAGDTAAVGSLGLTLVWCPPGKFTMGSPATERGRSANEDQVEVTLSKGFWIGATEVTQSQWHNVTGQQPWRAEVRSTGIGGENAASWVSWDDAAAFCARLTQRERAAGRLPAGWTFRLPTEAQWEYACRAGSRDRFSFGWNEAELDQYAQFGVDSEYALSVGQKKPNSWGIYDMHGNVWEWCRDGYLPALPGGRDPWVRDGSLRVLRGGNWMGKFGVKHLRCASRAILPPPTRYHDMGLRVVCTAGKGN